MKITVHPNGPFMVNSYIVSKNKSAVIIDPGTDTSFFIKTIKGSNLKLEAILATHGHIDHVQGVNELKKEFQVPFYMNSKDMSLLNGLSMQANMFGVKDPGKISVEGELPSGGDMEFIGLNFEFFHTPGHSKGSVSIRIDDTLFAGDVLFKYSIGRTDLPGGNFNELISSIKNKLFILPDSTKVLSGHGPATTIGTEKKQNPFLR